MLQQVWQVKEPLQLKAVSAKHIHVLETAAVSPDRKIAQAAINKQTKNTHYGLSNCSR
jgi:hypothetical protein